MNSKTARSAAGNSSKNGPASQKNPQLSSPVASGPRVVADSSLTGDMMPQPAKGNSSNSNSPLHHQNGSQQQNSQDEEEFSAASGNGEVPPAADAAFSRVPVVIKEPGEAEAEDLSADDLRELMAEVQFEDEDVRECLEEGFEALSEFFGSEHWRLTPRQARILGKPLAKLLNSIWAELCRRLPELFARWAERLPGLAGTVAMVGVVGGPKLLKQARIYRGRRRGLERSAAKPMQRVASVHSSPIPGVMQSTSDEVIPPRRTAGGA